MIIFTILLIALIAAAVVALVSAIIAGSSFIMVFGDAIVFVLLVWAIIKIIKKIKK